MKEQSNNSGVKIRPAVPLDCSNIARLIRASWERSPAAHAMQVNDLRTVEFVTDTLKSAFVIVADMSGRLVGAMACAPIRERWLNADDWFLCDEFLAIDAHWVTRGVGEMLLIESEQFADSEHLPMMLGGSLLNQPLLAPLLDKRAGYQRLGAHYLRMPQAMGHEARSSMQETASLN